MPRILLLSLVFAPDSVSTAVLMTQLAHDLRAQGHAVSVLTTTPHYNLEAETLAAQPLKPRWGRWLLESRSGDILVWHAAIPLKGARVGARMLDYLRFHVISTLAALSPSLQYDLILAPSPPLTVGLSAWLLGRLRRVPYVYNVQEIYPDIAVKLGVLTDPRLIRLFERLERFIYDRAAKVTVISEPFRQVLLRKGVSPDRLEVIPNFVDTDEVTPGPTDNEFARAHGLNGKFVVLYAGNIGLTQGFESVLEAAALTARTDIHWLIVGDGARRAWLELELQRRSLANVTLLPYQPRRAIPQMYAASSVCLVPLKSGTARDTFPSKLYTILSAGRPALVSADPDSELAMLVERLGAGVVVPPDNPGALAHALGRMADEPERWRQTGARLREFVVAHHSRQAVSRQYSTLVDRLTAGDSAGLTASALNADR